VHRLVPTLVVAVLAVGCQTGGGSSVPGPSVPTEPQITRPSPFTEVTDGPVHYLVPEHWVSAPVEVDGIRQGLMASPDLERWQPMDGTEPGVEAAWMKVSRVGVPSDFFYLAAKWPALPRLVTSRHCTTARQRVIVDHLPEMRGGGQVLGDFAATASGTCNVGGQVNRWSYFVAAPSFGQIRRVGLPDSGLYLVVAVVHDGTQAKRYLHRMVYGARFGHATVGDLVSAARRSARMYPS